MAIVRPNGLQALLSNDTKRITRSGDVLCHLFRDILLSRGVTLYRWKNVYYPRYMNGSDPTRDPRKDRGNLNNQLSKDYFTWAVFKRGVEFLQPAEATFSVILFFKEDDDGKRYTVFLDPTESDDDDVVDGKDETEINFDAKALRQSTLSRLFNAIVADLGIDKKKWSKLLDDYVDVLFPAVDGEDKKSRQRRRNTLDTDLRRKRMSWNTFRRGLTFIQAREVSFTLELKWLGERYPTLHKLERLPVISGSGQ